VRYLPAVRTTSENSSLDLVVELLVLISDIFVGRSAYEICLIHPLAVLGDEGSKKRRTSRAPEAKHEPKRGSTLTLVHSTKAGCFVKSPYIHLPITDTDRKDGRNVAFVREGDSRVHAYILGKSEEVVVRTETDDMA
jgi:hypothetical protein